MLAVFILGLFVASGLAAEVCYEPCGCFHDNPPFDTRPLPESPEDQEILWMLFTRSNPDVYVEVHWTLPPPSVFDASKPTNYMLHGWTSTPGSLDDSSTMDPYFPTMIELKDALLSQFDHNVIVIDWSEGASRVFYPQSASNTQVVGKCSGYLAQYLQPDFNMAHCIGHSLGGQTCGYMGVFTEGAMGRATGLDPAGPWFDSDDTDLRLDASDADFVDIHHTNGEGASLGLGKPIGDVDFYPHLAGPQPPCEGVPGSCDHSICKGYYHASIMEADNGCAFTSFPCETEEDALAGQCTSCTDGVDCQSMGYYSAFYPGRGTFYLEVNSDYPYCQDM